MEPELPKYLQSVKMPDERTIEIAFSDKVMLDLEAIKEVDRYCEKMVAGRKIKRLIIGGRNTQITREARMYGQDNNKKNRHMVIAEAFVVTSLPQKMVANFYMAFIKDYFPVRFFTDITKAREWLSQY
jgi:hypothetical protein